MPDTLCRLTLHATGADGTAAVDLVVPAQHPLGELMPSVVETVFGDTGEVTHWQLARVTGGRLDPSLSLWDNDVRHGDVLVLTSVPVPPPRLSPAEACGVVALAAADAGPDRCAVPAGVAAVVLAAACLVWAGTATAGAWHLWCAAALSGAAATGSAALGRADRPVAVVLHTAAVAFASVTGILAAPGAQWTATSLLAAASALAMSTVLTRVGRGGSELAAFSAAAGAVAAASALCHVLASRIEVAGTALVVLSLAGLAVAPRMTILAARLGDPDSAVDDDQAAGAHRLLTALVAGWSSSAASGVAVVATASMFAGASAVLCGAFCVVVAVVLLLRQNSHVDAVRRNWLGAAGYTACALAVLLTTNASPSQSFWASAAVAVAGVAAVRWTSHPSALNPTLRQGVQVLEYVALATVIPLAFWLSGLYGLVRDASLP